MSKIINSFKGEYFFLSNFYSCSVEVDGFTFTSSEHAYMSYKNTTSEWKTICQSSDIRPGEIKKRSRTIKLVDNWETIKLNIMWKVVYAKFSQNNHLKKLLLATGDKELIEGNTWNDTFWGVCGGKGENQLGKILMKVRSSLKA